MRELAPGEVLIYNAHGHSILLDQTGIHINGPLFINGQPAPLTLLPADPDSGAQHVAVAIVPPSGSGMGGFETRSGARAPPREKAA